MKEKDHLIKIQSVAMRRAQAKQSAEEAAKAMEYQKNGNRIIANLIREQAEAIKEQKMIESEIDILENQAVARRIIEVRETKPKEAVEKILKSRKEATEKIRVSLEEARLLKIEEERVEEEKKADKIRQLKALNSVHKRHVVVFDPSKTAGIGLLGEMSYMEMKERYDSLKVKQEEAELNKREELIERRQKKASDLEARALTVLRARQVKADATKEYILKKKEMEKKEIEIRERAREIAALQLQEELECQREIKKKEAAALLADQERAKRQQQYLGAAAGLVEEKRNKELLLAKERQIRVEEAEAAEAARLAAEVKQRMVADKKSIQRTVALEKRAYDEQIEKSVAIDKRNAVGKIKAEVLRKKSMANEIRKQHEITKQVQIEHNLYADSINRESIANATRKYPHRLSGTYAESTENVRDTRPTVGGH